MTPPPAIPAATRSGAIPQSIRPMRWWDIPAAVDLEQQLFSVDSPWTAAMFWSELAAGNHYLVLCEADVVIGYAGLASGPDEADVQTIGISPACRGRGLGRVLLRELLAAAGGRTVYLEVRTDNAAAIGLYESEGFARIGLRRRYYRPSGADAYTMMRPGAPDPADHR